MIWCKRGSLGRYVCPRLHFHGVALASLGIVDGGRKGRGKRERGEEGMRREEIERERRGKKGQGRDESHKEGVGRKGEGKGDREMEKGEIKM